MAADAPTVHASAVLTGARAVLIRGGAGAGKSKLALALIDAAQTGLLAFARLVGDDRVHLEPRHGRLLVKPAAALAGLIEVRGLGIRRLAHEPVAVVGLVVDLAADDADRLPESSETVDLRYYPAATRGRGQRRSPVCGACRPAFSRRRH